MLKRMNNAHGYLSNNMSWYQKWHQNSRHGAYHWLLFVKIALLVAIAAFPLTSQLVQSQTELIEYNESREIVPISRGGSAGRAQNRILVKFKDNVDVNTKERVLSQKNLKTKEDIGSSKIKIVQIEDGKTPEEAVAQLIKDHGSAIEFAEVDELLTPAFIPNDPNFPSQWPHSKINTTTAWDSITSAAIGQIIIGIADTGVNCNHPDLIAKCVPGWNFYDNNADTSDVHGHGTKVAGTAAAVGNNGIGVAGIAWGAKIMPLRISAPDGGAYSSTVAQGVIWAADHGVKVVNNSYYSYRSASVANAAAYLKSKGGMFVGAAGNSSGPTGATADNPDLVVAGGTTSSDTKYSWSSYGLDVDIVAPGCTGSTTLRTGGYGDGCGTSHSAPITAGSLAVIFAANPALTPTQAVQIMFDTAKDLGTVGRDIYFGHGRIDLAAAVARATGGTLPPPPPPPIQSDTTAPSVPTNLRGTAIDSTTVNLIWTASTDNVGVAGYKIFRDSTQIGTTTTATTYSDIRAVGGTTYAYSVLAYDSSNNSSARSAPVSVTVPRALDTTAPTVPTNLRVTAPDHTKAVLTWTASTDNVGVTGYRIYRDGVELRTNTSLTYTDSTVAASSTYQYSVAAYDAAGNSSARTANVSVTIPLAPESSDTIAPSAPTRLTAKVWDGKVSLNWRASTDNVKVVGYKIFRNGVHILTSTDTTQPDYTITSGESSSYYVVAYDAVGNTSSPSNTTTVTLKNRANVELANVAESNITTNSTTISFDTNIGTIGYVYYGTDAVTLNKTAISGSATDTKTSHTLNLTGLASARRYYYKITVISADGKSKVTSSVGSFTTQ